MATPRCSCPQWPSPSVDDYVLVDPTVPQVTDSWPDAPVTVFVDATSEAAIPCRLRGWSVRPLDALPTWSPDPS
jgi:hypothetical protein